MPFDRLLDPVTHDYIDDGAGGTETTTTVATSMMSQFFITLNAWCLRGEAGNDLAKLLAQGDIGEQVIQEAREILLLAMKPMLDAGQLADPILEIEKDTEGRLVIVNSVLDVQSGTRIVLPLRVGV